MGIDLRVAPLGKDTREVVDQSAAGDVCRGMERFALHLVNLLESRQVAAVNLEKFGADGCAKSRRSVAELEPEKIQEDLTSQRISIGVKAVGG